MGVESQVPSSQKSTVQRLLYNNLCTVDFCEEGTCDSTPIDGSECDDGNACTLDLCDPLLGCAPEPTLGSCDDGDSCTDSDICADVAIGAGVPVVT